MKKGLIVLFVISVCAAAIAQDLPKIAVYVSGDISENDKKALGTRMLAAVVNSGRYTGIERAEAFLDAVDREHVTQRGGSVDDGQISALGKRFGVKYVCVADVTRAFGTFQVSARIIDVETAEVKFIAATSGQLQSMADLEYLSDEIARKMFGVRRSVNLTPLVPGMAQIRRGDGVRGALFIGGMIALGGGAAAFEGLRSDHAGKMRNNVNNIPAYNRHRDNSRNMENFRNAAIIGAVAVYGWNIIDGYAVRGRGSRRASVVNLEVAPYADTQSHGAGVMLTLNF